MNESNNSSALYGQGIFNYLIDEKKRLENLNYDENTIYEKLY